QNDRSSLGVDEGLGVWLDDDTPAFVRGGEVFFDALADCVHVGASLRERDAVLQTSKRDHPMEVARHVRWPEGQRPPDLDWCAVERTPGWQHADNRVRLVVEKDSAGDDGWIRAELAGPDRMTDDRHVVFAEFVFTGQERPAQLRLGAKHLEVSGGN